MADGFFRSKNGYTVVQNGITRDRNISLKAKGLYLVIQANITMPGKKWSKEDFKNMTCEGNKAFDSAWNELKKNGYLRVHMYSNGHTWTVEYELLDEADVAAHTYYYNSQGELTSTNIERAAAREEKKSDSPVQKDECSRYPHFGSNGNGTNGNGYNGNGNNDFGSNGNGCNGNGDNINNTLLANPKIKSLDKDLSVSPSINISGVNDETEYDTPVVLNPSIPISEHFAGTLMDEIEQNGGIPYEWAFDQNKMAVAIQALAYWNDNRNREEWDNMRRFAYRLIVQGLVEMATCLSPRIYNNRKLTYKNVIDQLNVVITADPNRSMSLDFFIDQSIDRFLAALREKKIKNPESYVKSLIWNNFNSFRIDWEGFFYRTYHGVAEE